jgi:hypothetical protein
MPADSARVVGPYGRRHGTHPWVPCGGPMDMQAGWRWRWRHLANGLVSLSGARGEDGRIQVGERGANRSECKSHHRGRNVESTADALDCVKGEGEAESEGEGEGEGQV